ncbi:acyl-CoA dehydrogenase [Desulfitobacterium sp. THU1]|uniref:acyl-CoA dehydrogenase n=1 Tax=Desulfitobacterium sp. THU1 TaxID=3138072 RepID=UPI00311DB2CD
MDFKKTEEQELLLEGLSELIARECPEDYVKECYEKHELPTKFNKALIDNGFGLLGIPEEYGGTPCDVLTLMLVAEETARLTGAPFGVGGNALQVDDMLAFGNDEQKKITMDYLMQGRMAFCLGISEPQAGSDNNAIATTATRRDGKVYINGHKTWITDATRSPYMLCVTRDFDSPKPPAQAMSMWWLPTDAPGVKMEPLHKVGHVTSSLSEVYLEDVELEEKDLVGREGNGFFQLMKNFEIERILMAAMSLGLAEAGLEDAAKYANQRVQFGQKIGNFQQIQEKLSFMEIKVQNMKNYVYKTAWEKDNGLDVQLSSSLAKLYCAQAGFEVLDDAMQIMGGLGYMEDCRIARMWKDSRMHRIGGGTDQIMVHIAGRQILKKYSK